MRQTWCFLLCLLAVCKTLASQIKRDMQPFEYRSVRYWSKEINGTLTGSRKKIFFLIRDIDDATRAGASMESCRFVVLRSLGGDLGSVLDMGNRLHRARGGFHRCII